MRHNLTLAALAAATLALASCSQPEQAAAPAEDNPTGLVISNARVMLPPVKGNPAAVYFDVKNEGQRAVTIRAADVADAKSAMMHGMVDNGGTMTMAELVPQALKPGETLAFAPGGNHVMAFDLSPEMTPGAKTELTLTIAGGDKVSAEAVVKAAGSER